MRHPGPFSVLALLLIVSLASATPDPVRVHAPLLRSNADGTKFIAFKSGGAFLVTVRLYEGPAGDALLDGGGQAWAEALTVTPGLAAPSSPATGALSEAAKVDGALDLIIGASMPLPADLLGKDVWFSTQVATLKSGLVSKQYAESPRVPLGIAGFTAGQTIAPASVTTDVLQVGSSAVAGHVLTADADGQATWQPVPEGAGVNGTTGTLSVFTSGNSIGDSLVSQSPGTISIDGSLNAAEDVLAGDDVIATGSVSAGADITAVGGVTASGAVKGANVEATGLLAGGSLTVTGGSSLSTVSAGAVTGTFLESMGDIDGVDFHGSSIDLSGEAHSGSVTTGTIVATGSVVTQSDIVTGTPTALSSSAAASGEDVISTDDVIADDDIIATDDVIAHGTILVGNTLTDSDEIGTGDIVAADDLRVEGTFIWLGREQASSPGDVGSYDDLDFWSDYDGGTDDTTWFRWYGSGTDENMRLTDQSTIGLGAVGACLYIEGIYQTSLSDYAEYYRTTDSHLLPPGTVVAVDGLNAEHVLAAEQRRNEAVLGIVSTAPGFVCGSEMNGLRPDLLAASDAAYRAGQGELGQQLRLEWMEAERTRTDRVPVALAGRVPVRVDGSGGAIRPGDRLGLSVQSGVAARYSGYGPVVGVALQAWDGEDTIMTFVHLEWSPEGHYQPVTAQNAQPAPTAEPAPRWFVPAGAAQAIVREPKMTAASRPVVTFFGNPGGASWISERGEGYFVLSLQTAAPTTIEFAWSLAD